VRRAVYWLLALFAVAAFFNAGSDEMRALKPHVRSAADLAPVFARPWLLASLYVSNDSDEHLYYEYSRIVLGEDADIEYLIQNSMGDREGKRARLVAGIRPGQRYHVPYRDFDPGYPPVTMVVTLLPRLFASTLAGYRVVLGALLLGLYLLCLAAGFRLARAMRLDYPLADWTRRGALLLLAIGPICFIRLDLVPTLLVLWTVVSLVEERPFRAFLCSLLAIGAKLYALLLLPVWVALLFFSGEKSRRVALRFAGAYVALGAIGLGTALLLGLRPARFASDLVIFSARPLQIESVLGSVLLALRGVGNVVGSWGSYNVVTPTTEALAPWWSALMLVALLGVAAWAAVVARRQPAHDRVTTARTLVSFTLAGILVLLCVSKILSTQYVIWAVPLVALVGGATLFRLYLALLVLSQIVYPLLYGLLLQGSPPIVGVLLVRNALLVTVTILALRAGAHPERAP